MAPHEQKSVKLPLKKKQLEGERVVPGESDLKTEIPSRTMNVSSRNIMQIIVGVLGPNNLRHAS